MIKYRVVGLDHFSYEYYEVGEYNTIGEAEIAKRSAEGKAETLASDSSIQDTYWIEPFKSDTT